MPDAEPPRSSVPMPLSPTSTVKRPPVVGRAMAPAAPPPISPIVRLQQPAAAAAPHIGNVATPEVDAAAIDRAVNAVELARIMAATCGEPETVAGTGRSTPPGGPGSSSAAARKTDATAVVAQERLQRKTTTAGSQVVRLEPKTGISEILTQPSMKRDAGLPTCMEVRSRWIVIGMSYGAVLVFDHFQQLKSTVSSNLTGISQAVSSVDVTMGFAGGELMVAGYADGTFVLWDLDNEKVRGHIIGHARNNM